MSQPRSHYSQFVRLLIIALAIIFLLPLVLMVVLMPMMMVMMGGMDVNGTMTMSPIWGIVMMVGGLAILLGLAYGLYRILGESVTEEPALEELRMAYARGDISQEEYEQRKDDLE